LNKILKLLLLNINILVYSYDYNYIQNDFIIKKNKIIDNELNDLKDAFKAPKEYSEKELIELLYKQIEFTFSGILYGLNFSLIYDELNLKELKKIKKDFNILSLNGFSEDDDKIVASISYKISDKEKEKLSYIESLKKINGYAKKEIEKYEIINVIKDTIKNAIKNYKKKYSIDNIKLEGIIYFNEAPYIFFKDGFIQVKLNIRILLKDINLNKY